MTDAELIAIVRQDYDFALPLDLCDRLEAANRRADEAEADADRLADLITGFAWGTTTGPWREAIVAHETLVARRQP